MILHHGWYSYPREGLPGLRATHRLLSSRELAPSAIEARPVIDHEVFTVREPVEHVITFFSNHAAEKPV